MGSVTDMTVGGVQWTVHPPSRRDTGRLRRSELRPGTPATPGGDRLRLLPSGPDLVHGPPPRGTRPSTPLPAGSSPMSGGPSGGNSAPLERIAGAGHRYLPA